jgi:glycosyltransferase involved in cell wall biosynthesis
MQAEFTIVMTVHNTRPDHLLEALHSITKGQTIWNGQEVIIVHDGSTDHRTRSLLHSMNVGKWFPFVTIYQMAENKGTPSALNFARSRVKTEWIAQMDSDDIAHPQRLEQQFKLAAKHPEAAVIGTNLFCFYDDDITRTSFFRSTHKLKPTRRTGDNPYWLTNHGTVIYKKAAVEAVGGYNEALRRTQDVDLWRRMFLAGHQFRNVESVLYAWRRFRK